jgi:cell division protein FtsB
MTVPRRAPAVRAGASPGPGAGRSGSAPQRRTAGRGARPSAPASADATVDGPVNASADATVNATGDAAADAGDDAQGAAPGSGGATGNRRQDVRTHDGRGRRNRLTGRATALFVVLAMLAVAYAWPVKEYLRQRSELAALRADTASTQARVDALTAEQKRWADPAYVKAQARDRLHYVMPGETAYVVLQPNRPAQGQTLPKATRPVPVAWYEAVWGTVQGADRPPTH